VVSPAEVEIVVDGLDAPRGVAVVGEKAFVADTGSARVLSIDPNSGDTVGLAPGPEPFIEPFDLAADLEGNLVVLDAGRASLFLFGTDGRYVGQIAVDPALLERARGIDLDPAGRIWIASTPTQRVVAVNREGAIVSELAQPLGSSSGLSAGPSRLPNGLGNGDALKSADLCAEDEEQGAGIDCAKAMQPVDVAGTAHDTVFVTDAGNHRIYKFGPAGQLLASRQLPIANSLDGPHIAVGQDGRLYYTEPEGGRIVRLDPDGNVDAVFTVRTEQTPTAKPVGIAVDGQNRIWVTDVQAGRVLRLTPVDGF
jgi:DNA-binding beta-propeller fold protein YncE